MVTSGVAENGTAVAGAGGVAGAMTTPVAIAQRSGSGALATMPKAESMAEFQASLTAMGKFLADAKVGGTVNSAQGAVFAWACISRGLDPFQFAAQYHLIDGKCQLQSKALLSRMMRAGVKIEWVNKGDDGKRAEAIFTRPGQKPQTFAYTIEQAIAAEVVKPKSAWVKYPAQMLRAAVIRDAAWLICPDLMDDDNEAVGIDADGSTGTVEAEAPAASRKPLTPKDAAKVAAAPTTPATPTTPPVNDPGIIETTIEKVEQPPFVTNEEAAAAQTPITTFPPLSANYPTAADLAEMAEPDRIRAELKQVLEASGVTVEQFVALVNTRNPGLNATTLAEVPDETITSATAKLRAKAAATGGAAGPK